MHVNGRTRRSSSQSTRRKKYPMIVYDEDDSYWYFYVTYASIRQVDMNPETFIIDRAVKILEAISDEFRCTKLDGGFAFSCGDASAHRHGGKINLEDQHGIKPNKVGSFLSTLVEEARESAAERAGLDLTIYGQTSIAYPEANGVRERFIGRSDFGPWKPARGPPYHAYYFDQILFFHMIDLPYSKEVSTALETCSNIWNQMWEGCRGGDPQEPRPHSRRHSGHEGVPPLRPHRCIRQGRPSCPHGGRLRVVSIR